MALLEIVTPVPLPVTAESPIRSVVFGPLAYRPVPLCVLMECLMLTLTVSGGRLGQRFPVIKIAIHLA